MISDVMSKDRSVALKSEDVTALSDVSLYDEDARGITAARQLNVDWSKFENHTFFGCAEANVNIALDKLLNSYPYDGTREQVDAFASKLTGFESWVIRNAPNWVGHARFSASWICAYDSAGSSQTSSPTESGEQRLSPESGSLSVEMLLNPASADLQIISQHAGPSSRWTAYVTSSDRVQSCSVCLSVETAVGKLGVSGVVPLNSFSSVCLIYDATDELARCRAVINGRVTSVSSGALMGTLSTSGSALVIGSGSSFYRDSLLLTPTQTLTASIDEFRLWRSARSARDVSRDMTRQIYAQPHLALYYKFNEPPPPLATVSPSSIEQLVLDSSGNAIHGVLTGSASLCRASASLDGGTLTHERAASSPVLFPEYPALELFRAELLASASAYDAINPNIILRLIPPHVLAEAEARDGSQESARLISRSAASTSAVGGSQSSSVSLTLSLLYTVARFFDELKIAADAFASVDDADFDKFETVSDAFIEDAVRRRGFTLPSGLFSDASADQYVVGDDISDVAPAAPLRAVRTALLRRFLSIAPDVIASKGTISSVEAALRSFGIDPDGVMRLRETADDASVILSDASETATAVVSFLRVSGSMIIRSAHLSGSRSEIGWPVPAGAMVNRDSVNTNGVSNAVSDGLYTSGSWSALVTAQWPSGSLLTTQSLFRLVSSGSAGRACTANVVAVCTDAAAQTARVTMYVAPSAVTGAACALSVSDVPLFNGDAWRVCASYVRQDAATAHATSASVSLTIASSDRALTTSSFIPVMNQSLWSSVTSSHNASGSMLELGGGAAVSVMPGALNDASVTSEARCVTADFGVRQLQFWSAHLSPSDVASQACDATSLGSCDPLMMSDAASFTVTGSFQKLRMSAASRLFAIDRTTDSLGRLVVRDDSRFSRDLSVSGAPSSADCGYAAVMRQRRMPTQYDVDAGAARISIATDASVSRSVRRPAVKFTAEMSLVDSLSRALLDAMTTTDAIALAIGAPAAAWSPDYPQLEALTAMLCDRVTEKLDFASYMTTNRWLESAVGTIINQIVPAGVLFDGASFVIEQHALERSKIERKMPEHYRMLDSPSRRAESLYLQQIVGTVSR